MTDLPGFKERNGTSQEAAEAIADHADVVRAKVYRVLSNQELTADEVARELGISVLTVRPRVSELHKDGLVQKTEHRRKNASGMSARVWRRA